MSRWSSTAGEAFASANEDPGKVKAIAYSNDDQLKTKIGRYAAANGKYN